MKVFKRVSGYFNFFESIPEDRFCTEVFCDYLGRCCAIGHLTECRGDYFVDDRHPFRAVLGAGPYDAASVNNGVGVFAELGATPKERILNALVLKSAGLWKTANGL